MIIQRFAPSPTGYLHLGHAYSAFQGFNATQQSGGKFLLRIEDIDAPRCKTEFTNAIFYDLHWLGIEWNTPVLYQSNRSKAYHNALNTLIKMDLCYPCVCTRKDIQNALSAPQEPAETTQTVYPNTCRNTSFDEDLTEFAIRLNMEKAAAYLIKNNIRPRFTETGGPSSIETSVNFETLIQTVGDIVLARKDIGTSYHIAVVIDDAFQNITHVTRGRDLQAETPIHCVLQSLLGYTTPVYHHHNLIRDDTGKRLAKRSDSKSIRKFRQEGFSIQDVKNMIGLA